MKEVNGPDRARSNRLRVSGSTAPYSKAKYWAPADDPLKFIKCSHGECLAGSPECFGHKPKESGESGPLPIGARPGYPLCESGNHSDAVLSKCGDGASGTGCAKCDKFKLVAQRMKKKKLNSTLRELLEACH